jgi:hypothetical protein
MKYRIVELRKLAHHDPGLWQRALKGGRISGDQLFIEIADLGLRQNAELRTGEHRTSNAEHRTLNEALEQMPWWVKAMEAGWPALRALARPGDRGMGDVVERTVGPLGGTAFKGWYQKLTGRSCGCGARREELNRWYPL